MRMSRDDLGRGLFDVGQVVELVSFSNINADISLLKSLVLKTA
jgi:hypothetical protein